MPIPPLPGPSFTAPPPLARARVAVVTTAGLMRHGEDAWTHDDSSFRVYHRDERDVIVGHVSMNFDRAGAALDRNVVFPVDRLAELADDGVIGSVAERHISFMGALRRPELLSTLILDSGPASAALLRADGVDVVVLTPVCPACSRTVTVLGHVLEAQGLSTVVLGSNHAITERARPPRALSCDFPLGRPLGRPLDAVFQRRVLGAALALLERPVGPVLEVFPETIDDEADAPMACALPPRFDPSVPPAVDEARALRPAWTRAQSKLATTHVGRRLDPGQVPDAIASFLAIADGAAWDKVFSAEDEMFQTAMDIRVYYEEAALGLSEHVPAARASEAWFYQSTETGRLLRDVVRVLRVSGQERELGPQGLYYLVPLSQYDGEDRMNPPWAGSSSDSNSVQT